MREFFGIELDDPPATVHEKVAAGMRAQGMPEEQIAMCTVAAERLVAAKVLHDAPDMPADELKAEIRGQIYSAWRRLTYQHPAMMIFDDLHWSDPASAELITYLLRLVEDVPILFVFAFRPEQQSPAWRVKVEAQSRHPEQYTEIVLRPLDEAGTDDLVSALLRIADLPQELRKLIVRKTEGNPYLVEEIVRTLIDQGVIYQTDGGLRWKATARVEDVSIPDSLQALLMARIDRLDREARETLQMASVIGRSFYYRILSAISDSAIAVDRHLTALERVELVRLAMQSPELQYMFKHELARDAAYGSMLNRTRRQLHLRVAQVIEALFPDKLEENAHRLAQHYEVAGELGRALKYYTMAGESAAAMYANLEAVQHFSRAVEVAEKSGVPAGALAPIQARRAALMALTAASAT